MTTPQLTKTNSSLSFRRAVFLWIVCSTTSTCAFTTSQITRGVMRHHPAVPFAKSKVTSSVPLSNYNHQSFSNSFKKRMILLSTISDSLPDVDDEKLEEMRKELEETYNKSSYSVDELLNQGEQEKYDNSEPDIEMSLDVTTSTDSEKNDLDNWTKERIRQSIEGIKKSNVVKDMREKLKEMKKKISNIESHAEDKASSTESTTPFSNDSSDNGDSTAQKSAPTATATATNTVLSPRDERMKTEIEKCKSMKIGELKKELKQLGVSTKSFFEKSELVQALANARIDGVTTDHTRKGPTKTSSSQSEQKDKAEYDPSYKDVIMHKYYPEYYYDDSDGDIWVDNDVIDIELK